MQEFNISSYIKILLTGVVSFAQGPLGITIFEPLSQHGHVNLSDKKISHLINRKAEVESALRDASNSEQAVIDTVACFRDEILPRLNIHTKSDMFQKILKTINSDSTTSPEKYEELHGYLSSGEIDTFLAYAFLYAINRPNRLSDSAPATDDLPLLDEVGNKCPLCQNKLTKIYRGDVRRDYGIVSIFPDSLDDDTAATFRSVATPPGDLQSFDNKIALCIKHTLNYQTSPKPEDYTKLLDLKQRYVNNILSLESLAKIDLETDIQEIINALENYTPSGDLIPLNMDALKIEKKISPENDILKRTILNNVLTYFEFIQRLFSEMEDFEFIQTDIRKAFKKLDRANWSQDEIIEQLALWILDKTQMGQSHLSASRTIVYYFIQNCEVFNEITE